jgi:hypothetical protein
MGSDEESGWPVWLTLVSDPDHPVAAAAEADARDAAARFGHYVIRGPLFGLAARAEDEKAWRVLTAVSLGDPQAARDSMQSKLWFRAKDEAKDRTQRRELLQAVARLETERLDDLMVLGVRYKVIRADEIIYTHDGTIEGLRPTDPEPADPEWGTQQKGSALDAGLVIDPATPVSPMAAAERHALGDLHYTAARYPEDVRADSAHALHTHPAVIVLPPAFAVLEETPGTWTPLGGLFTCAQEARKQLHFLLDWLWPRMPHDGGGFTPEQYRQAAAQLRAEPRASQYELLGRRFVVARMTRVLRIGPDGPEGPRPSDVDASDPCEQHAHMDEDGTIRYDV